MSYCQSKDVDHIAYKFRVYPTAEQRALFARAFGCRRFLYNTMLADRRDHYAIMGKDLRNEVSDYKDVFPFLREVDSLVLANAKIDIDTAFQKFFNGEADYPVFKRKQGRQSFTTNCSNKNSPNLVYDLSAKTLKLPKIKHPLQVCQHRKIKAGGILKSATVSKETDGTYHVSMLYEYPKSTPEPAVTKKAVGLDMSMEHFFVASEGGGTDFPRFYRRAETRLAKERHRLSLMKKDSNNYNKQKKRVSTLHAKIKHQRRDFLHKLSYRLVQGYDIICIESLNMKGMSGSLHLGKSVGDLGWGTFVRLLEYKCRKFGKTLIKVDKWYASSKTCSHCGEVHKGLELKDRTYICPTCGHIMDRDCNAAVNILKEGMRLYRMQAA